jgi:chaperonin cofactor prefoldin
MTDQSTHPTNGGTLTYRVGRLEDDFKECKKRNEDLEDRVVTLEIELGKLQERMTLFQAAQAMFTTIASAVAILLGRAP